MRTIDDEISDDSLDKEPADPLVVNIRLTMLERFMLLGIDRKWFMGQIAAVAIFAVGLKTPWVLLALLVTHPVLWLMVRKDPDQVNCYFRYSKQGDFYEPRQSVNQRRNTRPIGFGRGTLM
jgi:type IV secretion system protein TrbD